MWPATAARAWIAAKLPAHIEVGTSRPDTRAHRSAAHADSSQAVHDHVRSAQIRAEQACHGTVVLDRGPEPLGGWGEEELPVANDDQLQLPLKTDVLLHDPHQLAPVDVQEGAGMGQRVAAELIAQLHDGRTHPLHSHVPRAELSQHPRLDNLAPSDRAGLLPQSGEG